jgi:hypothetical protein
VHPDQAPNPLYHELKELLDYDRDVPRDQRRTTNLRTIQIAEHNEKLLKERIIETQNICLPTLNNLRTTENMLQLQERVYQNLHRYIDRLNICIIRSRTNVEADHCFNTFNADFESKFKPDLKKILLDY